jgi:outer membrane protein assembly factor BamB
MADARRLRVSRRPERLSRPAQDPAGALERDVVAQHPDGGRTRYDMGENVDTSAVLDADGNVYMGSYADKLVSLDPAGNFRWEVNTGGDVKSSPAIGPNGDIYVGSNSNKLYAFGKDGTKRWEYPTTANLESSPVVADDGTIYIGTKDAKLHAVLPTGAMKWIYPAPGDFDWQVLPALATDGTIYAAAGSKLVALRPDGKELWRFETGSTIRTPVIVDADGIVFVGADSKLFFAISATGNEIWRLAVGDVPYGFAVGRDGTLYVTCNSDKIYALRE